MLCLEQLFYVHEKPDLGTRAVLKNWNPDGAKPEVHPKSRLFGYKDQSVHFIVKANLRQFCCYLYLRSQQRRAIG